MLPISQPVYNIYNRWEQEVNLFEQEKAPRSPPGLLQVNQPVKVFGTASHTKINLTAEDHQEAFMHSNSSIQQFIDGRTSYLLLQRTEGQHVPTSNCPSFSGPMHFPSSLQYGYPASLLPQAPDPSPSAETPVCCDGVASFGLPSHPILFENPEHYSCHVAAQSQNDLRHISTEPVADLAFSMHSPSKVISPIFESPTQQSLAVTSPHVHQRDCYFDRTQSQPATKPYLASKRATPRIQHRRPTAAQGRLSQSGESASPFPSSSLTDVCTDIKSKKSQQKQKPPRTTPKGKTIDFVNFTPLDGRRILSSVAPSGSSKTKARRDREVAEKMESLRRAIKNV